MRTVMGISRHQPNALMPRSGFVLGPFIFWRATTVRNFAAAASCASPPFVIGAAKVGSPPDLHERNRRNAPGRMPLVGCDQPTAPAASVGRATGK